jgi:hypothetical protein
MSGRGRLLLVLAVVMLCGCLALAGTAQAKIIHPAEGSFTGEAAPGGPFTTVTGMAIDQSTGASRGDVYVANSTNIFAPEENASVVDKFDAAGSYAGVQITGAETPQGSFAFVNPSSLSLSGIAVDGSSSANAGDLYVGDVEHGVVDRFSEAGHYLCQITGSATPSASECNGAEGSATPDGSLVPTGVAVDAAGDVYVADGAHAVIDEFGPNGEFIARIADAHITTPEGIALDASGNLYVVNFSFASSSSNVVKLNAAHTFLSVIDEDTPTAVAVDPVSADVFAYEAPENAAAIAEYDPAGTLLDRFGSGHFIQFGFALAVGTSGKIYASQLTSGEGAVEVFGPSIVIPDVTSEAASDIGQTAATLHGHVDPDVAHGGGNVTSCEFEYGTTTSYGQTVACSPVVPYSSPADVSAGLTGLTPDTTYHYRLRAASANGAETGADETFTSFGPPVVDGESATAVVTSATLHAQIDPSGFDTSCQVQYVDEEAFQRSGYADATTQPCSAADLGAGSGDRSASATLDGLQIDTVYHYRFIATNLAGTTNGQDQAFAAFGIKAFSFGSFDREGQPYTQAGAHPYALTDSFTFNTTTNVFGRAETNAVNAKNIVTELPPGLIGNPNATPKCAPYNLIHADCAGATQLGVLTAYTNNSPEGVVVPIYNLSPPEELAAQFGSLINGLVIVHIDARLRTGGDYGVTAEVSDSSADEGLIGARATLWGVPADPSHDEERYCPLVGSFNEHAPCASTTPPVPFLTNPTVCAGRPTTTMRADSWQAQGSFVQASAEMPAFTGCDKLDFDPSLVVQPSNTSSASPTGLHVDLHVPQNENPTGLAEADLKGTTVTLPQGMTINPAGAGGLAACTPAQIELHGPQPPRCPDAAKIGSVEVNTPLVDHPLLGGVYIAQQGNAGSAQGANPFGSLLAIYIAVYDRKTGVVVKLAGKVTPDPQTGQLTTTFAENPQLPFEELKLEFFGGSRAPLSTPPSCGSYSTVSSFTPWSGTEAVSSSSSFSISSGPNGSPCRNPQRFSPSLIAGTSDTQAGAFSPFTLTMAREDGDQNLAGIQAHLPEGLLGMLSSVTPCDEPAASEGTCGPASLIGHTVASVGLGPSPYTISGGQVFITGPYKGAPYGLSIAEPAKAGPFDLGSGRCDCIVVRAKIEVDPHTSALTVTSDPLPTMLEGIPLQLKRVEVVTDRPGFIFNPTNCNQLHLTATLTSEQGASAGVSVPFAVANCATLPFKPKFTVQTDATGSKAAGAALRVKVTSARGQANIGKVKVDLPKQLPSRLTTLQKACVAAVFEANPASCPAASIVGEGTAVTPVLRNPLRGPAILVSHGGAAFPDLEIVLQGEGVDIVLDGNTSIKKGITSSTFQAVPDAPISTFDLVLPKGPHSVLATNLPLRAHYSFCRQKLTMPTTISGQNGATIKQTTKIAVVGCPKHKPKKPKVKHRGKKKKR